MNTHQNNTVNSSTNQRDDTRNSGRCDEYGRPAGAGGKDAFKYFFQTEHAGTDQLEFESLAGQQRGNEPESRESKNNTLKGAAGMFNEHMMPKFGDQSSISKDDHASTNVAVDSAIPQALRGSPSRLVKQQPASQEAPVFESKLRQKWKTKTQRKAKNKIQCSSNDRAGAASSPHENKYNLMSDHKLRSKFQDLMKQNQIRPAVAPPT